MVCLDILGVARALGGLSPSIAAARPAGDTKRARVEVERSDP
jgi:hypothetical protein